eukprot:gene8984-12117_t
MIYIESNNDVVDNWMNGAEGIAVVKNVAETKIKSSTIPINSVTSNRIGLGFISTEAKSTSKNDVFGNTLKKINKNKSQISSNTKILPNDDYYDDRGVVENIIDSRIAMIANNNKQVDRVNRKDKKTKVDSQNKAGMHSLSQEAKLSQNKNEITFQGLVSNKKAKLSNEPNIKSETGNSSEFDAAAKAIKKRTKTRSKQKNIRKDNRPLEQKPDYLKIGSKDYQGRLLTEATKSVLGIKN